MFSKTLTAAAVLAGAASSVSAAELLKAPENVIEGEYIVQLSSRFDSQMIVNHIHKLEATFGNAIKTKHVYNSLAEHGFAAYSVKLSPEALRFLLNHEEVVSVEENARVSINGCVSQSNPDWGLRRTNIQTAYTSGPYNYATGSSGSGVDVYIIDTGIYCANVEFSNVSCTQGVDYVDGTGVDGNGHGTHCAGTAAGKTYGVAKEASLIAVRVLDDAGSGSYDDIIAGVNWVVSNYKVTKKPSVANMSLGGSYSSSLNNAVQAAVDANVAQIVAAGNDNRNACNYSPSSASKAVTVGATDITDTRASYSNYGNCLDLFGPGSDITSAWIGSTTAINTISGTSMASPHVCGVAAKYLSANKALTAAELSQKLVDTATSGLVKNANGGTSSSNISPNLIVYGNC